MSFKMHQDFIVNNLCVMKDVEENTCQGACHLKRKLDFSDAADDSERGKAMIELVKRFNFYRCQVMEPGVQRRLPDSAGKGKNTFIATLYDDEFVHAIFHPPKSGMILPV